MTKTEYIDLRNQNRVQEIAFNYYKSKQGVGTINDFLNGIVYTLIDFEKLFNKLDVEYGVTLLLQNDKLVKLQD